MRCFPAPCYAFDGACNACAPSTNRRAVERQNDDNDHDHDHDHDQSPSQPGGLGLMGRSAALLLVCIWAWITLYWVGRARSKSAAARRKAGGGASWQPTRITSISSGAGWLAIDTKALNALPARLLLGASTVPAAKSFDEPSPPRSRSLVTLVDAAFGCGAVLGVLGVGAAFLILTRAGWGLLNALAAPGRADAGASVAQVVRSLRKRAAVPLRGGLAVDDAGSSRQEMTLRPMIPGVTLPLSQLPALVLAIVISQSFHELGHGFAAALENVSLLSTGAYLVFPLLPVFYVSLPEQALSAVPPTSRLKIATAGVWHNFLLGLIAYLLWEGGGGWAGSIMRHTAWWDVSGHGVLVASIASNSPLAGLIHPGNVVTHLDDYALDTLRPTSPPGQPWTRYLLDANSSSADQYANMGWCVAQTWFDSLQSGCCRELPPTADTGAFCFQRTIGRVGSRSDLGGEGGCFDTAALSTMAQTRPRCVDADSCSEGSVCVRPGSEARLTRLAVQSQPGAGPIKVLVYRGSRRALHQEVRVTTLSPKWRIVPLSLANFSEDVIGFILSICCALAFMNLLPVAALDGSAIIDAFLASLFEPSASPDLDLSDANHPAASHGHARLPGRSGDGPRLDPLVPFCRWMRALCRARAQDPGSSAAAAAAARYRKWRGRVRKLEAVSTVYAGVVLVGCFVIGLTN